MNLSYRNRIALYYMLATASVIAVVFLIVYFVVQSVAFRELDGDLAYEAHKHTSEIFLSNDSILFINKLEWAEREHREVQVNPVFIQIVDQKGRLMDKSPNLKEGTLRLHVDKGVETHFDTRLNNQAIRQVQIPIVQNGVGKGYILTAMSQEGTLIVLNNLKKTLLLLFPSILIGLFFITRFLAGRSIVPVTTITQTTDRITRNNLNERVPLPPNKDELHALTSSINELLDRIQEAIEREKQFTADASHQLRTPLAVLKGTLEVLVRKPRTEAEYQAKIQTSITEIDRISDIVEQLLILARFDKAQQKISLRELDLSMAMDDILQRLKHKIQDKQLAVNVKSSGPHQIFSDPYYLDLILENLLTNAVKYSSAQASIVVSLLSRGTTTVCQIEDSGIGIKPEDLEKIFLPFFRSDELDHKEIKGNGLGLSIVKKACDLLKIEIQVDSHLRQGTRFTLVFPAA